jgi:hypothetical protein
LSLVGLTCSNINSVCFFTSLSSFCIDDILSRHVIMEIVHKELKLLLNLTLLIDREVARILFNEIATNKTIISDINKDNRLYI